jgi:hypothetical protein
MKAPLTQTRREAIWPALLEAFCGNDDAHECLEGISLKQLEEIFFAEALLFYGPPPLFAIRTSRAAETLSDFRHFYARETVIVHLRKQMECRKESPVATLKQKAQSLFYRLRFRHEWKELAEKISEHS